MSSPGLSQRSEDDPCLPNLKSLIIPYNLSNSLGMAHMGTGWQSRAWNQISCAANCSRIIQPHEQQMKWFRRGQWAIHFFQWLKCGREGYETEGVRKHWLDTEGGGASPGGLVFRTPYVHCRGQEFDPWTWKKFYRGVWWEGEKYRDRGGIIKKESWDFSQNWDRPGFWRMLNMFKSLESEGNCIIFHVLYIFYYSCLCHFCIYIATHFIRGSPILLPFILHLINTFWALPIC